MIRKLVVTLALGLLASACGPRISVRREQPARANLGPDSRVLHVTNGQAESVLGIVFDPLGALARTLLVPHAVRTLEAKLQRSPRYTVVPGCGDLCPPADTRVEVMVQNVEVEPGNAQKATSKTGRATVAVRVVKRGGQVAWEQSYSRSQGGGVPGSKGERADNAILVQCVEEAVDAFYQDLHPQWIYESFRMEDEGPLKPCAEAAVAGDLDQAEAIARQVLAANPNDAKAIYNLGALFTARGQLQEALDAFTAAAALDKKYKGYARAAARRLNDRAVLQGEN